MKRSARRALCALLSALLCLAPLPVASAASDYDRPGQKLAALTFDDGPGPYSDLVLDTLQKYGAKATFCMNGFRVEKYPEQVRRMAAEGHQLANHTYDHPMLTKLSDEKIRDELASTARLLTQLTGLTGADGGGFYLRPPYGDFNARVGAAAGVPAILWSVDTQDWKYQDAERLVSYTGSVLRDGDIVLMHESHKSTAQGLDALLRDLTEKGFELVTVEELFWRRGVTPEAGQSYARVRDTGVERCPRALWFDESRLDEFWAYPAIRAAREAGWMEDNDSGEFLPNFPLTRGVFVTALGRLHGADAPAGGAPFADVPDGHPAAQYAAWAKASGVMGGVSGDRFEPERPITRQELATVLARYVRLTGAAEAAADAAADYADAASIAPWAADGVSLCASLGLLLGGSDGRFLPRDNATRAMGAVVLERLARLEAAIPVETPADAAPDGVSETEAVPEAETPAAG